MTISAIILTKNEEEMIEKCLESILWCDEIVVIDDYSSDKTMEILKQVQNDDSKIKIFKHRLHNNFAKQRNFGLEKTTGEWILYIDADERVSLELKNEIVRFTQNDNKKVNNLTAYKIKRKNFYFGNHQWPYADRLERLIKKDKLKGWYGDLHETAQIEGEIGELDGFLYHYTHRDLSSMVAKTIEWSGIEARLRFEAGHPKMSFWRFGRVMLTAFWDSYIKQQGWRAGIVGLVESIYQSFSMFITYARLWELQNKQTSKQ